VSRQRFRYSPATTVAAIIAAIAGISLGSWAPYLLPVLIVPVAIALYTWRAGTDADSEGLVVRTVRRRRLPWTAVTDLVTDARGRVSAQLTSGQSVALPAVRRTDLPRLIAASGQELVTEPAPETPVPAATTPAES
jgi:hypothetical protein